MTGRFRCANCGGKAHRAIGVYLARITFLICDSCGRPTLRCGCR